MTTTDTLTTAKTRERQQGRLLTYLREHKTIQPLVAWERLGIYRLAAVIHRLRKDGHDIVTEEIDVKNTFGERVRVARYRLRRPREEQMELPV